MENKKSAAQKSFEDNLASSADRTIDDVAMTGGDELEPVLDEEDLEENGLSEEEVEDIEWEEPQGTDQEIHNPENDLKV